MLLIQRTIILFWACCDQLSYITSWGRLLQYYPLFQLHLTFSQHLRDKSISKGYNEAVNVHSATKTAAINNLKNVEIEAEVHKKTLLDSGTSIQEFKKYISAAGMGRASGVGSMALSALCRQKAVDMPLRPKRSDCPSSLSH